MDFQGIGYFRALARYNEWANSRLYAACLALPQQDYAQDRKAFFSSIGRTLNHILVGDRLWLARFRGMAPETIQLDAVPYPDREALWRARQQEDAFIIALFEGIDSALLKKTFDFLDTEGVPQSVPVPLAFGHFFNHQTHHRGQVHNMLSQAGVKPPELDLSYFYYEAGP